MTRIAQWFGSFGSMLTGMNAIVQGMTTTLDGQIVPTGNFNVAGGGSALRCGSGTACSFSHSAAALRAAFQSRPLCSRIIAS
jgi:hypothetical protein